MRQTDTSTSTIISARSGYVRQQTVTVPALAQTALMLSLKVT